MDKKQLGEFVKALKPEAEVKEGRQFIEVSLASSDLFSVAKALKENEETRFDYLVSLTGVDWGSDMGVIYHLNSTKFDHMIVLRTKASGRENPALDSVTSLWASAEFHEREVYDLLGIRFNNHPDLRRLFLDSSWGYPLRKDYVDDINIVTK